MKTKFRKASALLMALVTIAVLSVMVLSFSYEARQQSGINLYVRERNRVIRLIDAGQTLAEIVLLNYSSVADWSEDADMEKLLEDDRWVREKQDLKSFGQCKIGPILLDEKNPESGTITVEIQSANSGSQGVININNLYSGAGDAKYMERWWMIFLSHDIPEELDTPKDGKINLWNILISSWNDWRDEDNDVTNMDGEESGAESKWYEDEDEDQDIDEEDRRRPRNGPIVDIHELGYLRGWREYPQVLTGGVINPWERNKDDQITVRGIEDMFTTVGSSKININTCQSVDALITVPGVYEDPEDSSALEEARAVAQAILDALKVMPTNYEVDESRDWWPFKDWNDLVDRVEEDVGSEASQYFSYTADTTTIFKVKIVGESMGMTHEANAECYVKDSKVRYIKWRED